MEETLKILELQSSLMTELASSKSKYVANPSRVISLREETTCLINSGKNVFCASFQNVLKHVVDME